MRTNRKLLLLACLTASPTMLPAYAQVAPPPPKAPEKTPEYVPPAPTVPPAPPPAARRANPRAAANPNEPRTLSSADPLPDIPYESLVKRGEDGKIIRLTKPTDYAATEVNPVTKGPISSAELIHFMHERQMQFEEIVIENLDLVIEIEGGFFTDIDWSDRANYAQVTQRIRPLAPVTPFNKEAEARQIMTRIQSRFNAQISREYDMSLTREARSSMTGQSASDAGEVMNTIMRLSIAESLYAYDMLADAVAQNLDGVHQKLTLNSEEEAAFAKAATALAAADGNEPRRAEAKSLIASLTLDNGRAALRAAREIRPEAVLPVIPPFEDAGVEIMSDPEVIKAVQAKRMELVRELQAEMDAGHLLVTGPDNKQYIRNADGTLREPTPEEFAAATARSKERDKANVSVLRKTAQEAKAKVEAEKLQKKADDAKAAEEPK